MPGGFEPEMQEHELCPKPAAPFTPAGGQGSEAASAAVRVAKAAGGKGAREIRVTAILALAALAVACAPLHAAPAGGLAAGPCLRDVTETTATIVWETARPAPGTLRYGATPESCDRAVTLPPARLQRAVIRGLRPGSLYFYRVDAGGSGTPAGDPSYSFRTRARGAAPFEFAVIGEAGAGPGQGMGRTSFGGWILAHTTPAFAAVLDCPAGEGREDWRRFLRLEEGLSRSVPVYAVPGGGPGRDLFFAYYAAPRRTAWRSFDLEGCHFIFLDIPRGRQYGKSGAFNLGEAQWAWLQADLRAQAKQKPHFTMVFFQAPVNDPDSAAGRELLASLHPLFRRHGVDLVFDAAPGFGRAVRDGLFYIAAGGAGSGRSPGAAKTGADTGLPYFLRVGVSYPVAVVEAVGTDGRVLDAYAYWAPERGHGAARLNTSRYGGVMVPPPGGVLVEVYSLPGCGYCHELMARELPRLAGATKTRLLVVERPLDDPGNLEDFTTRERAAGRAGLGLPAVAVGRTLVAGQKEIRLRLRGAIEAAARDRRAAEPSKAWAGGGALVAARFASFRFLPVVAAGLLDGINPCAFSTIVFLLSYLIYLGRRRGEILTAGIFFTCGVFLSYTALGLGLSRILRHASFYRPIAEAARYITLAFALVLGVLNLRDYFLCRRGRPGEMGLQLPVFLKRRIHARVRAGTRRPRLALSSLCLGFAVSLFELACTGQVYLPAIVYMLRADAGGARAVGLLVAYNLAFVLPLALVFVLAYRGLTAQPLAAFFARRIGAVKLATALLLFGLGALVFFA
ncbi:MAG: cytochrome c biogenesis protein CcdA [Patescibacteria group bacterium]